MNFSRDDLQPLGLDADFLHVLLQEHVSLTVPRLNRLWDYYRNPFLTSPHAPGPGVFAQQQGLPARLRHSPTTDATSPREIVIENDIAWRIHTLVDYMFGRPFVLQSLAADPTLAQRIETFLNAVFQANGQITFFHDLALMGSIYGQVDLLLRLDAPGAAPYAPAADADFSAAAARFVIEIIDAPRAVPILHPDDYRRLDAYVVHYVQQFNRLESEHFLARLGRRWRSRSAPRASVACTEIWTDRACLFFHDGRRIDQAVNLLGRIPVIHIQNLAQPFHYAGLSDVEPLIPLQDELNTRLSDRANRITMQAFRMYLGRGIEGFCAKPVGPGQMWATDNPDASIQEFGGDAKTPSEDAHINEIRDAMDKTSGVNAIAAGLLRDRLGNLTSENALRFVMTGLLAKVERRRVTYGQGIEQLGELLLHAADVTGILPNAPADRRLRIDWPSPLPENTLETLREAKLKIDLGVPREQVLAELGYRDFTLPPHP